MKNNMAQIKNTDNVEEIMEEFENEHVMIVTPKKVVFYNEWIDNDGTLNISTKTKETVKDEWAHKKMFYKTEGGKTVATSIINTALFGVEGVFTSYKPMSRWKGMCFRPDGSNSKSYNIFRGFPIKPKEGDIEIFTDYMEKVFGEDDANILLDWFAAMYQYPSKKVLWSIATRGEKGTGKNTVEEMLGRGLLHVANYFRTSDKEAIFGRFTNHLASNLLMVGQEIVWGGEHQYDSKMKELITETTRKVEPKGVDAFTMDNYSRLYMTSNSDWIVPASGKGERRYFVTDTNENVMSAKDWTELYKWYENTESKEALMYEMINRDLSNFNWNKAPETEALLTQLEHSLYGMDKFVHTLIEDGEIKYSVGRNEWVSLSMKSFTKKEHGWRASDLYEAYMSMNPKSKMTQTRLGAEFLEYMKGEKKRNNRGVMYIPASRTECGTFFENKTMIKIELKGNNKKWDEAEDLYYLDEDKEAWKK